MPDTALAIVRSHGDFIPASDLQRVRAYLRSFRAHNTNRAYAADWTDFSTWCESSQRSSFPASPETVVAYLTELTRKGKKVPTLNRRLSAISQAHQIAGWESPTRSTLVRALLRDIRQTHGTATRGKEPLLIPELKRVIAALPKNLLGFRDRALLLVGFAGALRRSELAALKIEDLSWRDDGITVCMRCTIPDGGRELRIPFGSCRETCPVRALKRWLDISAITTGPIFRGITRHGAILGQSLSGTAVANIVKRSVEACGLDANQYAAHSLRTGLTMSAALGGAPEWVIRRQTGHGHATLAKYLRTSRNIRQNAASFAGV
jgi:site-specific recombinase XerD